MARKEIETYREYLKDSVRKQTDFSQTDQNKGVGPPPMQKPYEADSVLITLPGKNEWHSIKDISLMHAINHRKSRRDFTSVPLRTDELAFLLWSTQGIRKRVNAGMAFRTVPSAGCRHPFETYLCILNVDGIEEGIYRYLPIEHALVLERKESDLSQKVIDATYGQYFIGAASVVFIWTTLPYRTEWRYDIASHKVIAIESGHVCQNLYLACEAINAGTCGVAAYDQEMVDTLIGVDGVDEFTVYLAPVGKV